MGTVYNDVLHTYSPYGPNNYMPHIGRYKFNQRHNYENNIKALREKENTFYSAIQFLLLGNLCGKSKKNC